MTACNMASSMLDNSIVESTTSAVEACTTIYDSPALQAASEAAEIISDVFFKIAGGFLRSK